MRSSTSLLRQRRWTALGRALRTTAGSARPTTPMLATALPGEWRGMHSLITAKYGRMGGQPVWIRL